MKNFANLIWGILFILVGLIVGLNAYGVTRINIFFDGWWTLFIIIPCFIGLIKNKDKTGSIIGILIGIVLLLCSLDILNFEIAWNLALPVLLVLIGLSIIFKNVFGYKDFKMIENLNKEKSDGVCSTFSSESIDYTNEKFVGTDLTAVFGSIKCDLRKAIIEKDVVINVSATFAGVDIYIPENVKVKVKSTSIFGGVDEKKKNDVLDGPVIYINATCMFGGLEIK